MPNNIKNEKLIRDFLLNELSDDERFEFEKKFIKDEKLFEQIKLVEEDLIEKYVRGWMNAQERAKFEKNFLTTKRRREKVHFSSLLIDKIQNAQTTAAKNNDENAKDESFFEQLRNFFLKPQIAMATAFAVLIAAFGGWFVFQNLNFGNQETAQISNVDAGTIPNPTQTPIRKIPANVLPNAAEDEPEETENEAVSNSLLKEIPKQSPKITEKIAQKTPTPTPKIKSTAPNPVLALFAGTVRSGGKNKVLSLPENAKGATIRLNLENSSYETFQAEITNGDGFVIFSVENLKRRKAAINFFVPAENLQTGDYLIKLSGKNNSDEYESAADYQFRVK